MNRQQYAARRRDSHAAALATLHTNPAKADGAAMFRRLRRLECATHRAATHFCNGALPQDTWEQTKDRARRRAAAIFGGRLPRGFFINSDPRGYALKIDPTADGATVPHGLETDWGQYGILAPEPISR